MAAPAANNEGLLAVLVAVMDIQRSIGAIEARLDQQVRLCISVLGIGPPRSIQKCYRRDPCCLFRPSSWA